MHVVCTQVTPEVAPAARKVINWLGSVGLANPQHVAAVGQRCAAWGVEEPEDLKLIGEGLAELREDLPVVQYKKVMQAIEAL